MSILNIKVGKLGIEKVEAVVSSVADGNLAGRILEVSALPLRLLNDTIREAFVNEPETEAAGEFTFRCACGRHFVGSRQGLDF